MAEPAVIQATWSDWQTVKTRNSLKLIFEVPLDQQQRVLSVLGPPLPNSETWVAIARLQAPTAPPERAPEPPIKLDPPHEYFIKDKPRNPDAADRAREAYRADNEMGKAARLAGMLRKDPEYQKWIRWLFEASDPIRNDVSLSQRAALGVISCSEIATDPLAYERWKQHLLAFEQATGRAARPS